MYFVNQEINLATEKYWVISYNFSQQLSNGSKQILYVSELKIEDLDYQEVQSDFVSYKCLDEYFNFREIFLNSKNIKKNHKVNLRW